jgi:iturin family lipopeptide synthetase A
MLIDKALVSPLLIQDEQGDIIQERLLQAEILFSGNRNGIIHPAQPGNVAFIQFSSGSTGMPKGVVLTHANLLYNIFDASAKDRGFGKERFLSWLPLTHDMGMILVHLRALVNGYPLYLMPTALFVRRPVLWIEKANEYRATTLFSPNFGYRCFMDAFRKDSHPGWDLSSIIGIINGAEAISPDICREFTGTLAPFGLHPNVIVPGYGLAEACVAVTAMITLEPLRTCFVNRQQLAIGDIVTPIDPGDPNSLELVHAGPALDNCSVRIANDHDEILNSKHIGHIQIKGKNVTSGYYRNEKENELLFTKDGWLKTGDIGFLDQGRIVVAGRSKELIIIQGENFYPHDIERIVSNTGKVRHGDVVAAACRMPESNSEELIVFVVHKGKPVSFLPVAELVREIVFEKAGIAAAQVVPVRKIPKTTSGKLQRVDLVKQFNCGDFENVIREMDDACRQKEKIVTTGTWPYEQIRDFIMAEVLQMLDPVVHAKLTPGIKLVELGMTSSGGVQLRNKLERMFDIKLPVYLVFRFDTVDAIARYLAGEKENYEPLKTDQQKNNYENDERLLEETGRLTDEEIIRLLNL